MVIAILFGTMICAFAKVEPITPTRWTTIVSVKNDEEGKTLTVTKRQSGQNVPYVYENQFIRRESPPEYLFQYTNGSTTYTYTLLDKDEDGNYFIFCADRYGKVTLKNLRVNNVFDPDPASTDPRFAGDLNIAVWLNNDFLKGYTGSEPDATGTIVTDDSYDKLDTVIKDYIVSHDWEVEGNNQGNNDQYHLTTATKNDYKVHCKIALPSISEYINYWDKIGYSSVQYLKKGNLSANSMVMFRTPFYNGMTPFYYFFEKNGDTSQCTTTIDANSSYAQYYFRPCFYVSRDYFKNVRIENPGEEVIKMLKKDYTYNELLGIYTAEELAAWGITGGVEASDATITGTTAQFTLTNYSETSVSPVVIFAAFDAEDNMLKDLQIQNEDGQKVLAANGGEQPFTATFDAQYADCVFKAFVFESLDNIKPYCKQVEFTETSD